MKKHAFSLLLLSSLSLTACSTAMLATTSTTNTLNQQGRSFSTSVSDQKITYQAMKTISKDPELAKSSRVAIVVFEHNVLIVGQTPTQAYKEKIEAIVKSTNGVRHVYNDMTIGSPLSAYEQGNDGVITGNIKTRMFTTTNLRGRNIKVITENGTVYLMGNVSQEEGRIAAEVARNSAGVKKVVKLFEYTG